MIPIIGPDLLTVEINGSNVSLYPFLAKMLARYLEVASDDLPAGSEFNEVACRYLASGNAVEDIYPALKTVVGKMDGLPIPSHLLKLAEIHPLRLFVSTTFDDLMERALDKVRENGQAATRTLAYSPNSRDDLPIKIGHQDPAIVYRLFGKLSATPLSYALTQEDVLEYVHALQSDVRQPNRFFDRLAQDSLLLIGNSFTDWLTRFFMRAAKRERFSTIHGSVDYVVDQAMYRDYNLVLFLQHFSRGTKVFQGGNTIDFVNQLHERWVARPRPRAQKKEEQQPSDTATSGKGAIFLSYASEDLAVATRVYVSLDEAGVDVYFDKENLRSGDNYELDLCQGVKDCSLFIPLISRHTLTNERSFFRIEWNEALSEAAKVAWGSKFILPVVIDDTPYDAAAVPEKFRKLHWEKMENGRLSDEFIANVLFLYREYQKF